MQLGFIGLGRLGRAIVGRLVDCGHSLTVWNRTPSRAEGMGLNVAPSPSSVADRAEVVFMCLFDSAAVHDVLTREDGLLSGNVSGKIVVDLTTNHFRDVKTFYSLCDRVGCTYLESPVLGSVIPASKGLLTVLVSGDEAGFERVVPLLEKIGRHIFYLGEAGLATKMKLINNLTLGSFMATLAEALAMGERVGVGKEKVLDILSVGGGDSLVLRAKKGKLLQEDFSPHFSSALIYKDLHYLQDLAYEQKTPLFTGSVVKELYARTFEEGIDQEDFSAVYKLFRKG